MSRLEELIKELCPNGIEYRSISEVGTIFKGMSGVTNKWADDGNCRFIDYKNAYDHLKIDVHDLPFATIKKPENQFVLQTGDILFTSASETPDECAISSVIEAKIEDGILLDDHLFGIRISKKHGNPTYFNYYFRSEVFRKSVNKTVRGVTRFYISMPSFASLQIPVPPIPVQEEIVRILDSFTKLTAELTAELTARKKQYEYYRNRLLTSYRNIPMMELGDVCNVIAGGTPSKRNNHFWDGGTIKWLGSAVCQNCKGIDNVTDYITEQGLNSSSAKLMRKGTTLIALVGATIGKVAFLPFEAAINQNIAGIYPKDTTVLVPSYVYYACTTLYPKFIALTQGSKLAMANISFVRRLKIPVPPLETQNKIVQVLDNFDSICSDLKIGLPAEIEARTKQYEYYRDKLLSFKEKS